MSLEIANRIFDFIELEQSRELKQLMDSYSSDQRKFIMSTDVAGSSLLYVAVSYGSVSIVTYFLDECGADPNSCGITFSKRSSCLSRAINLGFKGLVEILSSRGAAINTVSLDNNYINNSDGENGLMASLYKFDMFKYLVLNGADINLVDVHGYTILMHALVNRVRKVISFLLRREDVNVRMKGECVEDALNLAIRFFRKSTIKKIITKGGYTKEEVIRVYKLESCFCYMDRKDMKANRLWNKSLTLQGLPDNTSVFSIPYSSEELDYEISLFREKDIPPLLYLNSTYGSTHVFTIRSMATTLKYITDHESWITLYESLSSSLRSLNCREILNHFDALIYSYILEFSEISSSLESTFNMLECLTSLLHAKQRESMSPSIRAFYAINLLDLKRFIIHLVPSLKEIYKYRDPTYVIINGFTTIVKRYFTNSTSRFYPFNQSLLHVCLERLMFPTFKFFISCGADVNEEDDKGETILHYILDSEIADKRDLIEIVVEAGFDFSRVITKKYCLPCRMKKEHLFYFPTEFNTLQCLAANAICQKTVVTGSDLPPIIRLIIQTHMYIL